MDKEIDILESWRTATSAIKGGKPVNEDIGDFLVKKAMDTRKKVVKTHMNSGLFNPMKNAMKSIMKGNYQDAVTKMQRYDITVNSAAPTGIKIFGKRYEKIPFGIAAVAYPISQSGETIPTKTMPSAVKIIREMFVNDIQRVMSLRVEECHKYQDMLSFILTVGGKEPKVRMDGPSSSIQDSILNALTSLTEAGWNPGNINQTMPGFVDFIMRNGGDKIVAFLHQNRKLTISPNMISTYDIEKDTPLYNYITKNGPHNFELHEPDVTKSGDTITGGTFTDVMEKIGYDIKNPSEQAVSLNNLWVIQEQLGLIVKRYQSEGEKISNVQQINIFAGSTFANAKAEIKKIISEYTKLVKSPEWASLDDNGKKARLDVFTQRFEMAINNLTKSINTCLTACKLPPIKIAFKTDISTGLDDKKFQDVMTELGVAEKLEKGSTPKKPKTAAPATPSSPAPSGGAPTPAPASTSTPAPSATP